jgi:hypothetical protein
LEEHGGGLSYQGLVGAFLTYISRFPFLDPEDFANLCCGTEEEISVHILCECEALASLRHAYLESFFLNPKDVTNLSMVAIWSFGKGAGFL